jgi:hypothetical protein
MARRPGNRTSAQVSVPKTTAHTKVRARFRLPGAAGGRRPRGNSPRRNGAAHTVREFALLPASLVVLSQAPAWSGRPVTEEERMKLVAALAAEGCSGGEMEFDDGLYEVEDATCRDGKEYDLIFDANFKLLSKKLDDD